ncbi:hypothetical protein QVD17_26332 [Tagetes erecta]|uniref:Uncharacterized protein n=1 Tax=Tagetes erecta TaxID=13708 RepID=A0AAD8K774_TARER|nr:hypothetical protein QVD17_26332 [Tagetes erecta]
MSNYISNPQNYSYQDMQIDPQFDFDFRSYNVSSSSYKNKDLVAVGNNKLKLRKGKSVNGLKTKKSYDRESEFQRKKIVVVSVLNTSNVKKCGHLTASVTEPCQPRPRVIDLPRPLMSVVVAIQQAKPTRLLLEVPPPLKISVGWLYHQSQ